MNEIYIGLMSGTSVDGIDAALVDLNNTPKLLATHFHPIPVEIRKTAIALNQSLPNEIHIMAELDSRLGHLFADAAITLLYKASVKPAGIQAIGSHGQTIRHQPNNRYPYAIQIGDPNIIAAKTGITTVADFRRRDIANGGQGAPFAPIFHAHVLSDSQENRAVVNIGGISNITVLTKNSSQPQLGFDTGPGNGLIDSWAQKNINQSYDKNGEWAASGKIDEKLLERFLSHPYFKLRPPKSTGRDHFHLDWVCEQLDNENAVDVQTTLTELTAYCIVDAVKTLSLKIDHIILCGGGAHNQYLVKRIQHLASPIQVSISDDFGISADWLEAMLFAWLAQQTIHKKTLDMTKLTGAHKADILGGIYLG